MRLFITSLLFFSSLFAKDVLTVYTYSSFNSDFGPAKQLKQSFEQNCNCEVNFVGIGDGISMLNRLKLEGNKSKADVILGIDSDLIELARQAKLVQNHQISKPNLSTNFWSEDFLPYNHGYLAFIYDESKTKNIPKTLKELLNNQNNQSIIYQDPRSSVLGKSLVLWVNKLYPLQAKEIFKNLAKNTLTITNSWSQAYSLFLKGESDFVLSYSTSPLVHIKNGNNNYKAVIFEDGNYEQIETAAIAKNSKNPILAKQFLEFLLSEQAQNIIIDKNVMYPSIKMQLPKEFEQLNEVKKALSYSPKEVFEKQKEFVKQWQNALI